MSVTTTPRHAAEIKPDAMERSYQMVRWFLWAAVLSAIVAAVAPVSEIPLFIFALGAAGTRAGMYVGDALFRRRMTRLARQFGMES